MDHSDFSVNPGSEPEAQRGRRALDLLGRDLDGGLTEVIAGRYVVGERLGHGAHGDVHRARDRLTGETVAIKLLPSLIETDLVRLRSEIAALRLLRLPGVAHLYDEGMHHGRPFLVMELVEGEPFPGTLPAGSTRWSWELLRGPTLALLDTLARVHAAGLVHRDLKPRNVLVTAAGRPVLLDFGLTVGRALADDSASDSRGLGTPAYAAPEQCRGEPVDARADLYALGVMLWEALAGRRPHAAENVSGIIRARLETVAEPVARYAPEVPFEVADLLDHLLEVERDDRPRSAVEVAERLRGGARGEGEWQLRLVGRDDELRRLLDAALDGRPACLLGPRGSGHTRLLHDAAQQLMALGHRVIWARPASRPFESLAVLTGWVPVEEPPTLDAALDATADGLRRALDDGVVLLVDGLEAIDRWSHEVLQREAPGGAVLSSAGAAAAAPWGEEIRLLALGEDVLTDLFAGDDRLLHVHEDAARELWERTAGIPSSVQAEVEGWRRAGLVEPAGAQLLISRATVDRLRGGLAVLPAAPASAAASTLDDDPDELLAWIHLAWPNTQAELLTRVSGRTLWLLQAELSTLCEHGAARILTDGRVRPLRACRHLADAHWVAANRTGAHAALADALVPGVPGRLYHLVASHADGAAAREAIALAQAHVQVGRLGEAEVALAEGLRAARRLPAGEGSGLEHEIFREWLPVALGEVTPVAADRLLYQMGRSETRDEALRQQERLVRAAIAAYEMEGERALEIVERVPAFADAALERWRQALRVRAARRCPLQVEARVVAEACAWARGQTGPDVVASALEWAGRLQYREGSFAEAARLLRASAESGGSRTQRLSALLNAASALLEVPALDECERLARAAGAEAAALRRPWFEGRAAWLARAAAYRRGDQLEVDHSLVRALDRVGAVEQASLASLTESAIAWRRGDSRTAADLATESLRYSVGPGSRAVFLLARGLQCMLAAQAPPADELERLVDEACTHLPPPVAVQVLALLARSSARLPARARMALGISLRGLEPAKAAARIDVLSLGECQVWLAGETEAC